MKKLTSIVLTITILISALSVSSISYANETDYSKIESFIEEYYKAKDLCGSYDDSICENKIISQCLLERAKIQKTITNLFDNEKTNYNIKIVFDEEKSIDNAKYIRYIVDRTFNYVVLPEVDSEICEDIIVVVKDNKIVDMQIGDYFDEYVRGVEYIDNSTFDNAVLVKSKLSEENIDLRVNDIRKNVAENYNYEYKTQQINDITPDAIASGGLAFSNLNGEKSAKYARDNFKKEKPASGKSGVTYYDFSQISGSFDCTNFASHAILAGGGKMYDPGKSGISSTGWYFRSINNRSSSWSGVPYLYNYLVGNKKSKTLGGFGKTYSLNTTYWQVGDLVQFKYYSGGPWRHSGIITQKKPVQDNRRAYAYFTGRSSPKSRNDNISVSDFNAYEKRTVHLYNIE